jgi:hypothetical protein
MPERIVAREFHGGSASCVTTFDRRGAILRHKAVEF